MNKHVAHEELPAGSPASEKGLLYEETDASHLTPDEVGHLYQAVGWSAANSKERLAKALQASHTLVCARTLAEGELVGVGNAISDGHLVVYYPHLVVHPAYQRMGVGKEIARRLMRRYENFHQQVLIADAGAVAFHRRLGFSIAGTTTPMWIYAGDDHA